MKKIFALILAAASLLWVACIPENNGQAPCVTVGTESLSALGVVLKGKANLGKSMAADLKIGFQYSLSADILPDNSTTVDAIETDANYNFSASVSGLEPATTYYYRSFILQNSQFTYGETRSFTTKDLASLLETKDAGDIEATKATMNAKLDLTDVQYTSLAYGFLWGGSETALNTDFKCSEMTDNAYSASLTELSTGTKYWYKAYVALDSQTFYGEVKTFTTKQYVTSITLSKTSLSLLIGAEETISVTSVLPDNANDKTYTWSSSDNAIAAVDQNGKISAKAKGNAEIRATANDGSGVFAACAVSVKVPYTTVAGEAVDLGLSVKWSSMNLGATSPTGYGDYFAWGETSPKDNYSWSTYELCMGSSSTFTKYNNNSSYGNVDNKTEFKDYNYEDDAARQALGGKWRTPTDAEWTELRAECSWTWETNYNGSGINGRLVKSKTNDNSIFLPVAGYRDDANLYNAGFRGYYWSSSLYTDCPSSAWYVGFYSLLVGRGYNDRYSGRSVRPVSE